MIATIKSFIRATRHGAKVSDIKVDPGGGPILTAEYFSPIGDDSQPLSGDYTVAVRVLSTGRYKAVGYIDPENQSTAGPGEKRIYSRSASGGQVAQVWLKSDGAIVAENDNGSITISSDGTITADSGGATITAAAGGAVTIDNGAGNFTMAASGTVTINGVTIDTSGNITTPATVTGVTVAATTSLTVASKEMGGHIHYVSSTPGNSGPPV